MKLSEAIERFRNREIKAKDAFDIRPVAKGEAYGFVSEYHYLGKARFLSSYQYGLFPKGGDRLLGVAAYGPPGGISSLKGWFGVGNSEEGIVELTRLCLDPRLNGSNASSFLLSNSMRMLKAFGVRAVITLADSSRHVGSVYQNCNFKYYGLTDPKQDMYSPLGKNVRGRSSLLHGVWLPRTRKHRYAYILDPSLKVLYPELPRPGKEDVLGDPECCRGLLVVHDGRFDEWFTCPKCTSRMVQLSKAEADDIMANHKGDRDYVEGIIGRKSAESWLWWPSGHTIADAKEEKEGKVEANANQD